MKLDWKSILVTGLISILSVIIYNKFLRPYASQIPIIGGLLS